ncbi:Serine/threonine protein kinase [Methylobacterium sp. ap11]|uniref:serine/threonine-protein kinase n=1 Tax=Methylobacterium sp. ap11 TaxID=1761799 RepID=UPI0008B52225|nr:serine/threonine-protein kinase [Methylobacterium sp. ap11]SEP41318.1 Serine/threonine protein kinase [Methylobacterium sp. ap11]
MSRAEEEARRETLRVQVRLDALAAAIGRDGDGRPRPEPERRIVLDAARSALDRLADPGLPAAPPGAADATLLPETIVANTYAVRERIGRGGLAEVYRVRHRDLRSDHAAKVLRPDRAVDPVLARLHVSEARALMSLSHPAIPRARDLLRHGDGRAVIVMDLLRGETLAEALRARGALPSQDVAALARRLSGALAAVHAAGLVHGDVSPENVMLCGGAQGATLIDFGVVRRAGEALPDVEFAGKWSVAAPEQLDGLPGGPPADLYALGLLLAAASRGERVGTGRDRESAQAARASLPDPRIDGRLGRVVRALLARDPEDRPDAEAVRDRLDGGGVFGWLRRPSRAGA